MCFELILIIYVDLVYSENTGGGLNELIEKVYDESKSGTVYFVQFDQDFLSEFVTTHPQTPVSIIQDFDVSSWTNITSPAILVVQAGLEVPVFQDNQILTKLIAKIKVRKFVIIAAENLEVLKQNFAFFTKNKFTRILGITDDNTSYAYLPFDDDRVKKLSKGGILPNPLKNLNGFTFRTIIQKDIPRTFPYTDKQGKQKVGGCFGQLFAAFLRHHNATYKVIFINNSTQLNIPAVKKATADDQIDISFNAHPQSSLDWSYPVKVVGWVIMVPINGYVNPHEYFKKPFTPTAWLCIGLALVYITLMRVALNKLTQRPLEIWPSFSQIFLTMLMLPTERATTLPQRLYLQVFLFSFIICNIYVIFFTSFLTAFIPIKQFDTLEDLLKNNFPILVSVLDWRHLSRPGNYPIGIRDLHVPVDHTTYYKELLSMKNTSYAYTLGRDRRDFLVNMQASLAKPLFRKARQTMNFYLVGYILPFHSPFKDILNDFVIRVKETGLMLKWDDDVLRQAPLAGFDMNIDRSNFNEKPMNVPLNLRHFQFAWICVGTGWIAAILVFLVEYFWSLSFGS
ncbi:uncharacterized protein LOC129945210 [Eupeodes corollae]|uniref:uncharacterized protein LOC129945210 n=1 Tax=Eupeodes corollae TaxID=290404 RepID=UPI00249019F6|nr:uncharacterized protein LOC129945210 [Eupeodes corollae]